MKTTYALVGLLSLGLAGPALAQEALDITVSPRAAPVDPLATGSVRPLRPNPNVTPSNRWASSASTDRPAAPPA